MVTMAESSRAPLRRQKKKGSTRDRLIAVATRMFCEKGYEGTSMSDIARALDVQNAAIYYYVASKQELLLRVLEEGMQGYLERLEEISGLRTSHREKMRLALENHMDFIFERPDAVAVFLREKRFLNHEDATGYLASVHRYDSLMVGILEAGLQTGEFPASDPGLTNLAIMGMTNWIIEWYRPAGRLSKEQVRSQMISLIMDRLLAVSSELPEASGGKLPT
jgi:AcrR family transcriptional regulator